MAFDFRRMEGTYLWVCVAVVALVALPLLIPVGIFVVSLLLLPFRIIADLSAATTATRFCSSVFHPCIQETLISFFTPLRGCASLLRPVWERCAAERRAQRRASDV